MTRSHALLVFVLLACTERDTSRGAVGDTARAASSAVAPDYALRDTACVAGEAMPSDTPERSDTASHHQQLAPVTRVECVLVHGEGARSIVLHADTAYDVITRITLLSPDGRDTVQRLVVAHDAPPDRWVPWLVATDFDADGARDLALRAWAGATGNVGYIVWRFDRAAGRFVEDSVLSTTPTLAPIAGRPCVEGRMKGGMAGLVYGAQELCRENGRWIETRSEQQDWDERGRVFIKFVRARRGDSMVVVRVDTLADSLWR